MRLVRRQVPSTRLATAGSHPTVRVKALADRHVTVATDVSDAKLRLVCARVLPPRRWPCRAITSCGARGGAGIAYAREYFSSGGLQTSLRDAMRPQHTAVHTHAVTQSLRDAAQQRDLADHARLSPEVPQHGQPLFQVGNQVLHILQSDMQPDQRPFEHMAGSACHEAGGWQRETLVPTPGGTDAEQGKCLDERVGALD
jgi:hypothetical protein